MPLDEFLSLLALVTHSQLIQRDMFQRRIESGNEIYIHELLYPVLQGYDSKMLESDLTIVGSDQLFNELMGRTYQEKFSREPQVVITTRITPGIDGRAKQSKTLGNYIALVDTPRDKFGKAMSIPDDLIVPYLEVYTDVPLTAVNKLRERLRDPYAAKKLLAETLVRRYHGDDIAATEHAWWEHTFSQRQIPEDLPRVALSGYGTLLELLQACVPDRTRSDIRRLVSQGAIRIDAERVPEEALTAPPSGRDGAVLKIGKRQWFRLVTSE